MATSETTATETETIIEIDDRRACEGCGYRPSPRIGHCECGMTFLARDSALSELAHLIERIESGDLSLKSIRVEVRR